MQVQYRDKFLQQYLMQATYAYKEIWIEIDIFIGSNYFSLTTI